MNNTYTPESNNGRNSPKSSTEKIWTGQWFPYFTVGAEKYEKQENISDMVTYDEWKKRVFYQLQEKISGTLHDIYSLPRFEDTADIITFIKTLEWNKKIKKEKESEFKEKVFKDLCLAHELAVKYLEHEWYFVVGGKKGSPQSIADFMKFLKTGEKYKKPSDKISHCVLLKEILSFFRVIRYPKFQVNHDTGMIDVRNKEFINKIVEIFNSPPFHYSEQNNEKPFSNTSTEAIGSLTVDQKKIDFYASFNVKWLYSVIEKMDWQEKYDLIDAFNDIHRMRIEVRTPDEAIRIGKILFEKFWSDLVIHNKGEIISDQLKTNYISGYLISPEDKIYKQALEQAKDKETKKASSPQKEFRLSRSGQKGKNAIEIQIVLVDNHNETGWAHHKIYEIRRKINAKIRRYWWIRTPWIHQIIEKVFEENTGKNDIPFSKEQIFQHIISDPDLLMEIEWSEKAILENMVSSTQKTSKSYTTEEVLKKYRINYPNAEKNNLVNAVYRNWPSIRRVPISEIIFSDQPNS